MDQQSLFVICLVQSTIIFAAMIALTVRHQSLKKKQETPKTTKLPEWLKYSSIPTMREEVEKRYLSFMNFVTKSNIKQVILDRYFIPEDEYNKNKKDFNCAPSVHLNDPARHGISVSFMGRETEVYYGKSYEESLSDLLSTIVFEFGGDLEAESLLGVELFQSREVLNRIFFEVRFFDYLDQQDLDSFYERIALCAKEGEEDLK